MFKNCALFTNCISRINNTPANDAYDIDVVMPMYDLIEHSDSHSKTSAILWQYCRDKQDLAANNTFTNLLKLILLLIYLK